MKVVGFILGKGLVFGDKGVSIIDTIDELRLDILPTYYSFASKCLIGDIDSSVQNIVKLILKNQDGKELYSTQTIAGALSPEKRTNVNGLIICTDYRNVLFSNEGIYTIEVIVNDEIVGVKEFNVMRGCEL